MSTQPPGGAGSQPPHEPEPVKPPAGGKVPAQPVEDSKDAYLLKSPFAKMFTLHGGKVTAKEMRAIINGILKSVVDDIKKQDARWKKAMEKMKKTIEGND